MNRGTAKWLVFTMTLLVGFSAPGFVLPGTQAKEPAKVFVGYVYRQPQKINFGFYTHLCHAFVVADEDGKIRPSKTCPSRLLVHDAHKAGVKVLLSLGGWGWDKQFTAIVSKAEAEDRYVASVMAIVNEYDYDGIDLDWEYPDTKEKVVGFAPESPFPDGARRLGAEEVPAPVSDHGRLGQPVHAQMAQQQAASGNHGLDQCHDLRLHGGLVSIRGPPFATFRLLQAARTSSFDRTDHEIPG